MLTRWKFNEQNRQLEEIQKAAASKLGLIDPFVIMNLNAIKIGITFSLLALLICTSFNRSLFVFGCDVSIFSYLIIYYTMFLGLIFSVNDYLLKNRFREINNSEIIKCKVLKIGKINIFILCFFIVSMVFISVKSFVLFFNYPLCSEFNSANGFRFGGYLGTALGCSNLLIEYSRTHRKIKQILERKN